MNDIRNYSAIETLRDGMVVTVRSLRLDDRERVAAAVGQLDRESIYTRLFSHRKLTEAGLNRLMSVDPDHEVALLVTVAEGSAEIAIASGRYIAGEMRDGKRSAEVAFVVEEDYQGRGIAGRLLKHLAAIARERGINELEADVLSENGAMLAVFARSGLPMQQRREGGTVHVTLDLAKAT